MDRVGLILRIGVGVWHFQVAALVQRDTPLWPSRPQQRRILFQVRVYGFDGMEEKMSVDWEP